MKLDLNFNSLTKLRDWWKQIYSNLCIIESECTETRKIADAACTKEELEAYVAEFAGSTDEYMTAIEAFTEFYNQNESSVIALEEIFGDRLRYYHTEIGFDINTVIEDAIYICETGTLNAPSENKGILISAGTDLKLWFNYNGDIYFKNTGQDWTLTTQSMLDTVSDLNDEIQTVKTSKCEVVFGTYTGDGETSRFIDLGFTPVAVEVYERSGAQFDRGDNGYKVSDSGGLALRGHPCGRTYNVIEIADNGFYVSHIPDSSSVFYNETTSNLSGTEYYFIAYKNGEIMEV